jgi:ABC-type lipoprotein release transport system permease subunit
MTTELAAQPRSFAPRTSLPGRALGVLPFLAFLALAIGLLRVQGFYALLLFLCGVPLSFLLLLTYTLTEARAEGVARYFRWLVLSFLALPLFFVSPLLTVLVIPLPGSHDGSLTEFLGVLQHPIPFVLSLSLQRTIVFLLAVRIQDLLLLFTVGRVPLAYNLRNLLVRWRTTVATALAFTLVVALLTVMLAFVNGMYRLTESSGRPGNVIVLADGATDELFSNLTYGDTGDVERSPLVLHDAEGRALASAETYVVVNQPIPGAPKGGRQRRFIQVRGMDDPVTAGEVHGLPLHAGGAWFSPAGVDTVRDGDVREPVIQAVLGEGIARELGHDRGRPSLQVGELFDIGPRKWVVTGILQSAGSTFDSEVWAKRQIVGPMFGKSNYTTLVLRTANAADAEKTAQDLTTNFKKSALQAQTESAYYDKLNGTNQQFLVAIVFVAVIMAIGGVFGVMNTMFAAISQRIKDIGVLRILGFSSWQILVSFLLESLVLALVGGLLGCALGYLANGWTASSIVGSGQGGGKSVVLKLVVDSNILATGVLLTLSMGALGGLLPALSAMRLKPLESLR